MEVEPTYGRREFTLFIYDEWRGKKQKAGVEFRAQGTQSPRAITAPIVFSVNPDPIAGNRC